MKNKIKKQIPNIITTTRIGLSILFPFIFLNGNLYLATNLFIINALSDALDGFLARKWHAESKYGKIVDPIADKLFSGISLIIASFFITPLLLPTLILESVITTINISDYFKSKTIKDVLKIGKLKSVFLFSTIGASFISHLNPSFQVLLYPLLGTTTLLQGVTIKEYYQRSKKNTKTNLNNIVKTNNPINLKKNKQKEINKLKSFKKTLETFQNTNKNNYSQDPKIKVLKKK